MLSLRKEEFPKKRGLLIKDHDTEKEVTKTPHKPQHPKKNQQHTKGTQPRQAHPKNQQNNAPQNNKNKHKENSRDKNQAVSKGNRSNNRYKDPDFEFDGIIESEGVLEMMPMGMVFYVLLITIICRLQMIFMSHNRKSNYLE